MSDLIDFVMTPPGYCEKVLPAAIPMQLAKFTPMEERTNGSFELMTKLYDQMNVRYLGTIDSANAYRIWVNNPIKDPKADFKGLKFRTGPDAAELLNALGIVGVAMQTGDMYNAIQQGVVTGLAGVANNIYDRSLFEVLKYWIDPGFWNPIEVLLINKDRWNAIPPNLQNLMLDVVKEIEPKEYEYQKTNNEKYFQKFKDSGMKAITFSPEDTQWYLNIAYQVRWDAAKKVMKPDDYQAAYQLWGK